MAASFAGCGEAKTVETEVKTEANAKIEIGEGSEITETTEEITEATTVLTTEATTEAVTEAAKEATSEKSEDSDMAPTADLSELLYGNRKRSVSNLLGENSNPTAHTLEQMAKFFGVTIDYFFTDEDEQALTESTPVTVYMRTIIDTQKKLIHDQEERIKNLEKIVALKEEEMNLYKKR